MKDEIRWLRIGYWAGAIADAYLAFRWLFQEYIMPDLYADAGYNSGQRYAAVIAAGWTILLIWADRKPQERKGILLITVFPVISGLTITNLAAFDAGFEATRSLVLGLIIGTTLIVLMTFSYLNAKRAERSVPHLP